MKDNKNTLDETGFSLTPDEGKETGYIQRLLTALILYAGFSGCVWTVLGLGGMGVSPVPLLAIGCAYCAAFCGLRGRWRVISILAAIALFVYYYAAWSFMSDGWNAVSNQVCQTFEVYLGRILPRYAINGEHVVLSAGMFLATGSAALAILCGRTAQAAGASSCLSGLLALVLLAAALIFRVPYPTTYLIWVVSHAGIPYKNGSLHDLRPEFEELFGRDMSEKYSEVIRIQQQAIFSDLVIYDGKLSCFKQGESALICRRRPACRP
jgi:hypothetical protein